MKKLTLSLATLIGLVLFAGSGQETQAADIGVTIKLGSAAHRRSVHTYRRVVVPAHPVRVPAVYPYPAYRIGLYQDGAYLRVAPGVYPVYTPGYRFYY